MSFVARAVWCVPVLAMTACNFSFSTGSGPNYSDLESQITDELNTAYAPISQKVSSVTCPRSQSDPKPGDTFVCDADVEDVRVRVEVTVEDDEGNVRFSTLDILFDLAGTAQTLEKKIAANVGFPVTVDCGKGLEVVPVGKTFTCTAVDRKFVEKTVEVKAGRDGQDDWRILD